MALEEPKDRLRAARLAQKFSRQRLAEILGWSPSTIRAHETGQNQIRPDAATAYRDALGVSPSWLLYGTPEEAPVPAIDAGLEVPVVGELWEQTHFIPIDELDNSPPKYIRVYDAPYRQERLEAFLVRGKNWNDRNTKYVICLKPRGSRVRFLDRILPGNDVVLKIVEGRLRETALWRLQGTDKGQFVLFKGDDLAHASSIVRLDRDEAILREHVIGVVVAEQVERMIWPTDEGDELDDDE